MMRLKRQGNAGRRRAIEKPAAQIPGDANEYPAGQICERNST
jgi:hypothetical protein